jgi:formate-nitrite transporter family protein
MTTTPPHTTRIPAEATAWSYDRAGLHLSSPRVDDRPEREDFTPERAFTRSIEEGRRRLNRRFTALVATGLVGGVDVATGVLAYLLVMHETGSKPLAGLAFGVGFVALTLARSELFTEGFLVPVTTVAARKSRVSSLFRLWGVTAAANLVGGWVITALIVLGLPHLSGTAVDVAGFYAGLGVSGRAFALAVLGGAVITLMTWMQHTTEVVVAKLVAAVAGAFLLATGSLNHAVIDSLVMFTALHTGEASFGYAAWAATAGWAALGNIVGGVGLVTSLRLLQVPHRVALERRHPEI